MPVSKMGADGDAALSTLLQEALTGGFLLFFCIDKTEMCLMEVIQLCLATS